MPKNEVINISAAYEAICLLGGQQLLDVIRMTYEVLDRAERRGFEEGLLLAASYDKGVDEAETNGYHQGWDEGYEDGKRETEGYDLGWDEGYANGVRETEGYDLGWNEGYTNGVRDARVNPERADSLLTAIIEWGTPASDTVNTFDNYGLTSEELAARQVIPTADPVADPVADLEGQQQSTTTAPSGDDGLCS